MRTQSFSQLARLSGDKRTADRTTDRAVVTADERALIDAALAAGRRQVVPSGPAAGLSRLEQHLGVTSTPSSRAAEQAGWRGRRTQQIRGRS